MSARNEHCGLLAVQANGTGVVVLFRKLRLLASYFLLRVSPSEGLARWALSVAAVLPVPEDLSRQRAEQDSAGFARLAGRHVVEHNLHDAAAWKIALGRESFGISLFAPIHIQVFTLLVQRGLHSVQSPGPFCCICERGA